MAYWLIMLLAMNHDWYNLKFCIMVKPFSNRNKNAESCPQHDETIITCGHDDSWIMTRPTFKCKLWFLSYPTHARGAGYYHLTGPTDVNHETWIMIYSTFKLPKTCSALTWVVMPLNPLVSWEKLALLAYQHRNVHPPSSPKHLEILWPTDGPRITVNIF